MSVSKAEYLKRYMSDPAESAPKKKRKKKLPGSKGVKVKKIANLKIHDDDANDWARRPTAAEDEDGNSDGGIIDGAQALRDQYGDQYGDAATVYNPDDDVAKEEVVPTFRGKNTFTSIGGSGGGASTAPTIDAGSPPRQRQLRHDSDDDEGDTSPPRRRPRHDSADGDSNAADASPPRRLRHDSDDDDDDAAPARPQRHDSDDDDASPPRQRAADSDGDASPPRRRPQGDEDDASPPRRSRGGDDASPPRRRGAPAPRRPAGRSGRAVVEAVVHTGGLVDAASLKRENAIKKQKLKDDFAAMEDSGREAETTIRDKVTGKRLNPKLEKLRKRQEEEKKRQATEAKMKWGGAGSANVQAKEDKMREDLVTMAAPFARGRDDARLNDMQMETLHAEDPMAAYMMKQREKTQTKAGIKTKPKYKGPWPANRYNLAPGHLWDGVDRSNGFEKKYFKLANQQAATNIDAYKWSTENM